MIRQIAFIDIMIQSSLITVTFIATTIAMIVIVVNASTVTIECIPISMKSCLKIIITTKYSSHWSSYKPPVLVSVVPDL